MFLYLDETFQLGIDCAAMLSPTRVIVYGWAMAPRGAATELAVSAGPGADCPIEYCSFHPRPDVVPTDGARATANGFTLVVETPEDPVALALTLSAAGLQIRADLRDPQVETSLFKATAERGWEITFGLIEEAVGNPLLGGLMRHQGRPLGAFADWLARVPLVRGRGDGVAQLAEVEALATPSGEALVMLRAAGALPREAAARAVAIAWLRGENGLAEPVLVPPADHYEAALPAALACYLRLPPAMLDRLQGIELLVRASPRAKEAVWLRCQPASVTVPELLDATCRTSAAALALPLEATASAGVELLRRLLARREAGFAPILAALATPPGPAPAALPRLGLLLGADDPMAARLFHVTAEEFERRCDRLLVIGGAADEVAQAFARRGRLEVLVGVEAAAALREAAGRTGILAVHAPAFAEAVAAGTPQAAFAEPLSAADVARLLTLHAVAGCTPALADSLQRLLRARRAGPAESRFTPVPRAWASRHAAELVNAHLQRLWAAGGRALVPEPA